MDLKTIQIKSFRLRKKSQDKVYQNAEGIFTMSKFLSDHLIEYSNIPINKVHYVGAGINIDLNKIKK